GSQNGPIRDYHFDVSGPLVHELQYAFMRDWHFITAEPAETLLTEDFFPEPVRAGDQTARLISTGPVAGSEIPVETYFSAITLACKQIIVVTPYFVPPPEILRALLSAALRGVDVQLVVPKNNNHFYAGLASRALYEELLLAGVKIYERRPPFMHAKALLIDDECALIGTANLDNRSLNLNYESTVAVYSEPFVDRMKEIVFEDLEFSDPVDRAVWQQRPAVRRLLENLASLMNPVL
ncbi:MAG TPA: phospholipase D-like domain-containing protein, partial [Tichowtungia sp.]|nr:phospholipase D-like domain-containing protein [Tichowtungia sp.]